MSSPGRRCVIVVDQDLPRGRAVNAAALVALTMGRRWPELPGEPLIDAAGDAHPGLVPTGIAVLAASVTELAGLRARANRAESVDVVDLPAEGQTTTDYDEFRRLVAERKPEELSYLAICLYGARKPVNRLTGGLSLLG